MAGKRMRSLRSIFWFCLLGGGILFAEDKFVPNLPAEMTPLAREARDAFERGAYGEAEQKYRQMVAQTPKSLYALSNLGVTLLRQRKYAEAEASLREALEVAPNDAFSLTTLGVVYYTENKFDEAWAVLKKAVGIDPDSSTAQQYLGLTARQKGNYAEANKAFQKARLMDPRLDGTATSSPVGDFLTPLEKSRLDQVPAAKK